MENAENVEEIFVNVKEYINNKFKYKLIFVYFLFFFFKKKKSSYKINNHFIYIKNMHNKKLKVGDLLFSKKERMNNENDIENKDSFFPIVQKIERKKRNSINFSLFGMRKLKSEYKLTNSSSQSKIHSFEKKENEKLPLVKCSSNSLILKPKKNFDDENFIFEKPDLISQISKSIIQNSYIKSKIFEQLEKKYKFYKSDKIDKIKFSKGVLFKLNQNFRKSIYKFEFKNSHLNEYNRKYLLKKNNIID